MGVREEISELFYKTFSPSKSKHVTLETHLKCFVIFVQIIHFNEISYAIYLKPIKFLVKRKSAIKLAKRAAMTEVRKVINEENIKFSLS